MRTTKKLATLILLCTATWPALAFEKNVLTIWIGQDKGFKGLAEIGQRFTADSGMPVKVATPDDLPGQYDKFAATAKGPDIVIFAHDRFSAFQHMAVAALPEEPQGLGRRTFLALVRAPRAKGIR